MDTARHPEIQTTLKIDRTLLRLEGSERFLAIFRADLERCVDQVVALFGRRINEISTKNGDYVSADISIDWNVEESKRGD